MSDRRSLLALAAGMPGLALGVCFVLLLIARAAGLPPVQSGRTVTLAEAAALEDEADIVRLTHIGADPNAPSLVRRTRLRGVYQTMTPLEASVTTRHVGVMQLLVASGAVIDERNFSVLWCFATQRRNEDVLTFLRTRPPSRFQPDCATVRLPAVRP